MSTPDTMFITAMERLAATTERLLAAVERQNELLQGQRADEEQTISRKEAAAFVGLKDTRSFMEWVKRNKVPVERIGREKRFYKSVLARKQKAKK